MKPLKKRKMMFRSLRLSLRFIVPLAIALAILAVSIVPLVDRLYLRWSVRDMDIRSKLVASTLQEPLTDLLHQGNKSKINTYSHARSGMNGSLPWVIATGVGTCSIAHRHFRKTSAVPRPVHRRMLPAFC